MSRITALLVLVAVATAVALMPSAAGADDGTLGDLSVGAPAACGDPAVASIIAAECLQTEATDESNETPDLSIVGSAAAAFSSASAAYQSATGPSPSACRYDANVIFYTATEWIAVAQKLAAAASPCAEYWIHIPTLAANKLACRVNQAHQIRANGPRFHAMCEAHLSGWQAWVNAVPGRTWYAAGLAQRAQMAAVGFRVELGDTWSVNELTSAVRRGDGNARKNVLEFLRGLYDGGSEPDVMGNVFVVGLSQPTVPTTVYKENLKRWFADTAFWAEAAKYVRFWGQEAYGDIRNTLVPGESRNRRAEQLNDYLQQVGMLSDVAPDDLDITRSYLRQAHYPLANAAWGWPTAFGFTAVPVETMKQYIAIQEFAMRHYLGANPHRVAPTLGYAWSPRNHANLPPPVFRAAWMQLLEMLATSIAESLGNGGASQVGACGPPGEHLWCEGDYDGAMFNAEWQLLRSWD